MGKSNEIIKKFYDESKVNSNGKTALLGFNNNNWYAGDLYDIQLKTWDINSDWKLTTSYDTIICTRTAVFAKNPQDFIEKCYNYLKPNGKLFVDWGLGFWCYECGIPCSLGWVKNGKQQFSTHGGIKCYLQSTLWDKSFEEDSEVKIFKENMKQLGYSDYITNDVFNEVPFVLKLEEISKYFTYNIKFKTLWKETPQLYTLLIGTKNE